MIVYRAMVCLDDGNTQDVRLICLHDEPGFGYETGSGSILAKGATMAAASEALLQQCERVYDIDVTPYWQSTA